MSSAAAPEQPLPVKHLFSRSRRIIAMIVAVVLVLLLINLLVVGGLGWPNLKWASWPLLIGWALFILQYHPEMKVNSSGISMVNVLTDIFIPWTSVTDIKVKLNTEVHVGAKKYFSWGAPGMARRAKFVSSDPRRPSVKGEPKVLAPDPTAAELAEYQNEYQPLTATTGREAVSVRWNWWKTIITVLLVAFCVASIVL